MRFLASKFGLEGGMEAMTVLVVPPKVVEQGEDAFLVSTYTSDLVELISGVQQVQSLPCCPAFLVRLFPGSNPGLVSICLVAISSSSSGWTGVIILCCVLFLFSPFASLGVVTG
jgi:hypothetical protein